VNGRTLAPLLLAALLPPFAAFPAAPEDPACRQEVARLLSRLEEGAGLKARFRHVLRAPALNQTEVEEGTLVVAPGGRTRWEYSRPPGKLAVADGRTSVLYLPAERQAFVQRMDGGDLPLALRLLSGQQRLLEEVACLGATTVGSLRVYRLELLHDDAGIRDVEAAADAETGQLRRIFFRDALGNEISLELSEVEVLPKVDPALFRFSPPPGVTLFEGPGGP